ncbi:hypothetical protein CYK37_17635 [Mesorhizobium loti]|nr:hypothetical protein [Mesorhizobium loti]PLP58027.1 hypothetical protein CYK37_17635 [Mesorhizobium loti]
MTSKVLFVVNIDGDPDPETTPPNNPVVLEKYQVMKRIVDDHAGGKGSFCVQTSPMYRTRFFESPFTDFWHAWVKGGGDLALHPEEDLYCQPEARLSTGTHYEDAERMRNVIADGVIALARLGLTFAVYKNGYQAQTPAMVRHFTEAGIGIDMSCAPGIFWPEKLADWRSAPLSAFYLSGDDLGEANSLQDIGPLFEIPVGWSGLPSDTANRLLNTQYLVNEFSDYEAITRVWDAIVHRGELEQRTQIVSFLCHTYTMADATYSDRLKRSLDYMVRNGGEPVSPREAQLRFDGGL